MRTLLLAVLIVLFSVPAYSAGPNMVGHGGQTRSPAEVQMDQQIDQAYKSVTEKMPNRNTKVDPWRDMRGTSAPRSGQAR